MEALLDLEQKVQQLPQAARQDLFAYMEFLLYKYHASTPHPVRPRAGCMKGTFMWMSEDFNAPIDDFNGYQ